MLVRRVAVAATATVLTGSGLVATGAANAATPANSWSPTATHALSLKNATSLGAAPAGTPLRLTVGLAPRTGRAAIDALITRQNTPGSADYHRYLTPAQFTARFSATSATASAVRAYLAGQGMRNVTVAANRLQVTADATVAQAQNAFHTSIGAFRQAGKQVLANTSAALVPSSLAGEVTGVLGLSTLGFSAATPSVPKLTGYYPKEYVKVYDAAGTKAGDNSSLAVFAEGDLTQTVKDLRTAESKQGLRQVPVSLQYAGVKSPDTAGADEWDLDTQTSTGVAPNVKTLYIYIATSLTNADLARAINMWVTQDKAQAGSASLGECDILPFLDGSMTVDDIAFAQAAVQGQTFFASTGDTGSSCAVLPTNGVPGGGLPDTEYPAASPYAVGVGGTTLLTDDADNYTNEIAWNAGGGGISPVENSGFWQSGVAPSATADGIRALPDVALDADPTTGALIYVDGAPEQIGGTSLSSPLALGLWTRIQSSHGNSLGFAAPKLYALYKKAQGTSATPPAAVPGFHDIVAGSNGAYTALPGYDYTTGLGSFDVTKLSAALK